MSLQTRPYTTWDIPAISGSDSKRLDAIKKVFTNITKKQQDTCENGLLVQR